MPPDLRVLLVDDEPLARERIGDLVRATPGLLLVGEATNGLEALNQVAALAPDLLLLDVQMPELGGFDVVRGLEPERAPGIVFITAWDEHAIRAFEVNAIDYLLKPVAAERFAASMARAIARLKAGTPTPLPNDAALRPPGQHRTRFVVRQGNRHTFVAASDVCWLEGEDNYLRLHTEGKSYLVRGTMKEAESELDPAKFVRIHRGVIVNVDHIAAVESSEAGHYVVRLADGSRVRSSRPYSAAVRALVAPLGKGP